MTALRSRYVACALCACWMISGCSNEPSSEETPEPVMMGAAGSTAMMPDQTDSMGAAMMPEMMQPEPDMMVPTQPVDQPMDMPTDMEDPPVDEPKDMADEPEWESLITAEWEIGPNQERYFCQRTTLTEDVYFNAIRAINPLGTHHTALTAEPTDSSEPDGLTECNSALSPQGIFGSGVGTDDVFYPDGVGLKLRKGQQLLLNLHVFNPSDEPLTGTSGTAVVKVEADEVEQVAESVLAGPISLYLPAREKTTVSGVCTMTQDTTLFAVQPHMHQLGVHMKGVAESSVAGTVSLHDGAFDFDSQLVYSIDPVEMKAGDQVTVECTFDNTTDSDVTLGESSNAEMCFLVLHRFPAPENPNVTCFF